MVSSRTGDALRGNGWLCNALRGNPRRTTGSEKAGGMTVEFHIDSVRREAPVWYGPYWCNHESRLEPRPAPPRLGVSQRLAILCWFLGL